MDADLFLVLGLILGALAIPSILNAYSGGRAPRIGAIFVLVAAVMVTTAVIRKPGGYSWDEVPDAFVRVFAKVVN